jgi:hypothetical protein
MITLLKRLTNRQIDYITFLGVLYNDNLISRPFLKIIVATTAIPEQINPPYGKRDSTNTYVLGSTDVLDASYLFSLPSL